MNERLLSARRVGELLGITAQTVRLWIREGRLPAVRISQRGLRIPESAIKALITK